MGKVASRPGSVRLCHVLGEDADLGEAIPRERRVDAVADCVVTELSLPTGPWNGAPGLSPEAIGFLVLEGVLIRRTGIDGRFGVEIIGECDVIRPWQTEDVQTLPVRTTWFVLEATRLAVLDAAFTRRLGAYPELAGRLFERAVRRSHRLVVNMAIVHQARVDDRLYLLLWHFAGRWGRVRGDGVLLPLRLTHTVLADLVAARRPTVTSALSDLSRRGLVRAVDDGWLLAGDAPREPEHLPAPAIPRSQGIQR
jgi:CRP/FNR family cyclic AMP-dependent transcriptional regulator